jgi:hypothetical protein
MIRLAKTVFFTLLSIVGLAQTNGTGTSITNTNGIRITNSDTTKFTAAGSIWVTSAGKIRFYDYAGRHTLGTGGTSGLSTVLSTGHIFVGNGSNIATDVAVSGDVTLSSSGVVSIGAGKVTNAMLAGSISNANLLNSSISIAGNSTSLGGSVTQDQITGLSSTGIIKRTAANTLGIAVSSTDYAPATSGTSLLKGNGSGGFTNATAGSDYENPITFSTGLTRLTNTVTVNTSQNISTLSNLTSNGLVKTSGGTGALSIASSGTDYAPATSGSSILKGNGSGGFSNAGAGTDYESPLTFSSPLSRSTNTISLGTVPISIGGTNNTSFTTSSIPFYDGSKLAESNLNFSWDNSGLRHVVSNATSSSYKAPQTGTLLHLVSNSSAFNGRISLDNYVGSQTTGAAFQGRTAQGTVSSPTAAQADQSLALLGGDGYGTTGFHGLSVGAVAIKAGSAHTDTNGESYLTFNTAANGSTTSSERFRIGSSGQFGIGGATFGTTGSVFQSGGSSGAPTWGALSLSTAASVTGTLPVANGGTGITSFGTGVATWLGTPSWTNFNSAITGTAPYWSLASGGTLTGSNTITTSAPNQLTFSGSNTTTADGQANVIFGGTLTGRGAGSTEKLAGVLVNPTLTAGATSQNLFGVWINPVLNTNSQSTITKTSLAVYAPDNTGNTSSLSLHQNNGTKVFSVTGLGTVLLGSSAQIEPATSGSNSATGTGLLFSGSMSGTSSTAHTFGTGALNTATINHTGINFIGSYSPTSGTTTFTYFNLGSSFTVNQTSTATGSVTVFNNSPTYTSVLGSLIGYDYSPTVTSVSGQHIAIRAASGQLVLSSTISPAQITSNQNDYNPTGLNGAFELRLNSDAARNITSIAGGVDGRILIVTNVGSFVITIKDDDGSTGTAANRFALSADVPIAVDETRIFKYDGTSSRWRLIGKV